MNSGSWSPIRRHRRVSYVIERSAQCIAASAEIIGLLRGTQYCRRSLAPNRKNDQVAYPDRAVLAFPNTLFTEVPSVRIVAAETRAISTSNNEYSTRS